MTRIEQWVERYGWQLLMALIGGVVAVTTAKAQLDGKAEKSDIVEIRRDIQDLKNLVCRLPQYVNDSACRR